MGLKSLIIFKPFTHVDALFLNKAKFLIVCENLIVPFSNLQIDFWTTLFTKSVFNIINEQLPVAPLENPDVPQSNLSNRGVHHSQP